MAFTFTLLFTLLALFLASLTTSLPAHQASQDNSSPVLNSLAPANSAQNIAKRTTAELSFDGYEYNQHNRRADHEHEGDVYRLTKCFCIDTPSRDLPPVYGQYYGSYYGFDYYNYHMNKSYSFAWTCASGELETLNDGYYSAESYYLGPKCLSWMEWERKQCWQTGDGNEFCADAFMGNDYYYWNGQKRKVQNHPPAAETTLFKQPLLFDTCQKFCQTIPANTPGYMQDAIPYDHDNKLNLATGTVCAGEEQMPGANMHMLCDYTYEKPKKTIPRVWETWNSIETYTDQADMCKGCK